VLHGQEALTVTTRMRITYVARSFLDYRVPVLAELDQMSHGKLSFVTSDKWTPQRALNRLKSVLGNRAICLSGERSFGTDVPSEANTTVCLPYQPGLWRAINSTDPEVLVGDGFFQWTSATLLHRLCRRTPVVVCYERWAHTERNAQWYRRAYRSLALKLVSAVCCNGRLSEAYVQSLGVPSTKITTGHMAADSDRLAKLRQAVSSTERERLRRTWPAAKIVFLYVGQLIKRKGLEPLLGAWERFEHKALGQATLVVVGCGPEEAVLKAQIKMANLRHVVFAGQVDYERLVPYYAAADAFVIPTLEDNWSLVVPEAMACGLPILCSKYNGCWPELVQQGRNGWVFDPLDQQDTMKTLSQAVSHRAALATMGAESRAIVAEHSPRRAAEAILSACELALNGHRPANVQYCPCSN
jgi:glycosyltransferase involved in cell wall biosynthesis